MSEIRIYVADLAAYNSGKLHGAWIDASLDVDEMQAALAKMLDASPEGFAEEWAIHDYEGFEGLGICEYEGLESVHEKAQFIESHGKLGALVADHWCGDLEEAARALEENYAGEHTSLVDYAQDLTEETGDVPQHLANYIDYERMGRDMELGGDVYTLETGFEEVHVFWSA